MHSIFFSRNKMYCANLPNKAKIHGAQSLVLISCGAQGPVGLGHLGHQQQIAKAHHELMFIITSFGCDTH
jgi:hypothetical protein